MATAEVTKAVLETDARHFVESFRCLAIYVLVTQFQFWNYLGCLTGILYTIPSNHVTQYVSRVHAYAGYFITTLAAACLLVEFALLVIIELCKLEEKVKFAIIFPVLSLCLIRMFLMVAVNHGVSRVKDSQEE